MPTARGAIFRAGEGVGSFLISSFLKNRLIDDRRGRGRLLVRDQEGGQAILAFIVAAGTHPAHRRYRAESRRGSTLVFRPRPLAACHFSAPPPWRLPTVSNLAQVT